MKPKRKFIDGGESPRKFSEIVAERTGGPLPLEIIMAVQLAGCEGKAEVAIAIELGLTLEDVRRILD